MSDTTADPCTICVYCSYSDAKRLLQAAPPLPVTFRASAGKSLQAVLRGGTDEKRRLMRDWCTQQAIPLIC